MGLFDGMRERQAARREARAERAEEPKVGLGIGAGIVDTIVGGVTNVVGGVLENQGKKTEAEVAKMEVELETRKLVETQLQNARGFALQYEGGAKDVPRWIVVLRSLIRPIVTVFFFAQLIIISAADFLVILKMIRVGESIKEVIMILTLMPGAWWVLINIVFAFWFGGKIGENIVEKIKQQSG